MGDGNWKSYRSKEDQTQSISHSIVVTNFHDHVTARDLWKVCNDYEVVVDVFIPYKKSKAGNRFAFGWFIKVNNIDRLVANLCTIWIGCFHLHANVSRFHRECKPPTPSYPSNANERNSPGSFVTIFKSVKSYNVMFDQKKEVFQNLSLAYLEGLWALIETVYTSVKEKLLNHQEDAEDNGSQFGDKVIVDNDVERVSESICMHNNDLLYNNNHNNIMPDKDKVLSDDPFNLYDIQNKRNDSGDDLKYPPGFTPSVINKEEVNEKEKGVTSNEVNEHVNSTSNKLEKSVPKENFHDVMVPSALSV
uniref:RNA-directed DNA polymerase, eukaryota, nucleotide-binding alpha-beta plait domain protein n=1 Tax=Tanacetum cinerariifolium TaxID=118510 RepID=A0A699I4D5_TANCI|nr:RNA-directed DNA polymerase, eukaryota, nucleotide-binding alpha-beta plait domain protein [Tanacetum cinerariifolium]